MILLPNAGLANSRSCGDPPQLGVTPVAVPGVTPATIKLTWAKGTDESGGEKDIERYVLWRRQSINPDWGDPIIAIPSGQATYQYVDFGVTTGTSVLLRPGGAGLHAVAVSDGIQSHHHSSLRRVSMTSHAALRNERGIALVVVLLVVLAIAAIAAGAALLGSSTSLITVFHSRMSVLEETADAGLEEARSMVNAAEDELPGHRVQGSGKRCGGLQCRRRRDPEHQALDVRRADRYYDRPVRRVRQRGFGGAERAGRPGDPPRRDLPGELRQVRVFHQRRGEHSVRFRRPDLRAGVHERQHLDQLAAASRSGARWRPMEPSAGKTPPHDLQAGIQRECAVDRVPADRRPHQAPGPGDDGRAPTSPARRPAPPGRRPPGSSSWRWT